MASAADRNLLAEWIKDAGGFAFLRKDEDYMAVPMGLLDDYSVISANLSLRKSGTRVGNIIRGKLNPDHELAMSIIHHPEIPTVAVNYADAIKYLRKETFELGAGQQGWLLVAYETLPLGLLKSMPNRANNYYPADWRIRSESPFS